CRMASMFSMFVLIFCDDPSVEKAVHSAVHKFNQEVLTGHKLALYQILSASKVQFNGSESLYSVQFTSRRSDCPAGSSKPWTDCDYLSSGSKKPIPCNATVLMTETEADTKEVDCQIEELVVPERVSCMGCPKEIDNNSEDLKVPVSASIAKYNSDSNSTHLFALHELGYATRQVVAGFRYKLKFDMRKTTCTKAEHKELHERCVPNEEFVNCNSTVDTAPWRLETPAVMIQCELGLLPFTPFSRRRPPGFSPLRHVKHEHPSSTTSPPTTAPPPSKASVKEDSSEEDLSAPSSSSDPNDSPFHCPAKPWKPFHPVQVGLEKTKVEEAPTQPTPEGTLKDTDLLS
uniref:Kininogen-like n=1 Tax=Salarias fasciatus TaxID=181472 RepID=A0A672I7U4_SALFA